MIAAAAKRTARSSAVGRCGSSVTTRPRRLSRGMACSHASVSTTAAAASIASYATATAFDFGMPRTVPFTLPATLTVTVSNDFSLVTDPAITASCTEQDDDGG